MVAVARSYNPTYNFKFLATARAPNVVDCVTMSTQVDGDAFDIGTVWSTNEEGPSDGPCPTPLGPLDSKTMGNVYTLHECVCQTKYVELLRT